MPPRPKRDRRRRQSAHITPDAVALFRQGIDLLREPHDSHTLRDIKVWLAAALGRSKFRASPLDRYPRSLIGCDIEPIDVVLDLRAQLLAKIGKDLV